ncbi:hypothetical protein F444_01735 [Phytophthora nicotianae P1976]|uniref:Uncharacterized protein n=1 Tax=Phytophthora nicotianae P1976 TaxID=1317066 RepID=A0A081AZN5_PHYNI|nr:hypothetical protein F444_01735 [Phytophthora nicotianae P1976]
MGWFSPDTITDFVRRGDLDGIRHRLELGDDVNERRSFQWTPLIDASFRNDCNIIQFLLDNGADMELTEISDQTALHKAIDCKNTDAALLLTRRGACANKIGDMGRTPLQTAVKRDLLEVTAELLKYGADPTLRSNDNKSARDYVQWGPNREAFYKLLDAYSNLESAIRAKNEDAITVWLRKGLTGDPRATISGIDAAIQAQNLDAVNAILDVCTLDTKTFDEMIQILKSVETGIENAPDDDWRDSLTLAGNDFKKKWLEKILLFQEMNMLQIFCESVAKPAWIQTALFDNGWTALHYAASLGNNEIVRYLLVACGVNPLTLSSDNKTAYDLAFATENCSDMCWMLQQHMKKRAFSDHAALLLNANEVAVEDLMQLVGQMTSVYDVRILFNLGFRVLTTNEMHEVLAAAFNQAITEKLVFDDRAAAFFKMGLKECRRQKIISEVEQIEWDIKATKVNVENSEWVRQIKQSLQQLECRVTTTEYNVDLLHHQFDTLRNALIEREKRQIKQRERQRYISLLSSALILCGGAAIKGMFESAFDMCDPEHLLSNLSKEHMTDFLTEKTNAFVFQGSVNAVLTDAAIDPEEFAVVLREAAALERTEVVNVESDTSPPLLQAAAPELDNPLFPPKKSNAFRDAVHATMRRAKTTANERNLMPIEAVSSNTEVPLSSTPLAIDSQMTDEDMEAYPYHCAVQFSDGDLEQFEALAKYIEQEGGNINETLAMHVRPAGTDDTSSKGEAVEASALMYASYLGHVDIVKWFLDRADVVKTEKSFLTIKRSLSSKKSSNDTCIKRPTCSA